MDDFRQADVTPTVDETGILLVSVAARLTRLYGKVLGRLEIPLTFRQHRLLMRVHQGHRSLNALAAFGSLTLPTVSESVEGLVRRGLLTRGDNPADRRTMLLKLTPLGESAHQDAQAAMSQLSHNLLGDIPHESRTDLHKALAGIFDEATTLFQREEGPQASRGNSSATTRPNRRARTNRRVSEDRSVRD